MLKLDFSVKGADFLDFLARGIKQKKNTLNAFFSSE